MACTGNKKESCTCRQVINRNIFSDWTKKLKHAKGDILCLRGGGQCPHPVPFVPQQEEVILHLYPLIYMEDSNNFAQPKE